jgi:hypothetical protein
MMKRMMKETTVKTMKKKRRRSTMKRKILKRSPVRMSVGCLDCEC